MALYTTLLSWTVLVYLVELLRMVRATRTARILRALSDVPHWNVTTSLIVPFRGNDPHLKENIAAFLSQNATETIFVVDSKDDPAYPLLKKHKANILITTPFPHASGKCAALITGAKAAKGEVLVFADSDALAGKEWLASLVAPLQDDRIGATTGYRLFHPAQGFSEFTKSVWDEAGLSMMFSKHAFVWGGSFAIRKTDFVSWDIARKWETAISDDTIISHAVKHAGKRIRFAPEALVTSAAATTWNQLMEFTNRQIFMVRHFAKRTFKGGILVYGYSFLVLLTALASFFLTYRDPRLLTLGGVLVLALLLPIIRSAFRRKAIHRVVPELSLKPALLAPLGILLMFYNILHAGGTRQITWRGRSYRVR